MKNLVDHNLKMIFACLAAFSLLGGPAVAVAEGSYADVVKSLLRRNPELNGNYWIRSKASSEARHVELIQKANSDGPVKLTGHFRVVTVNGRLEHWLEVKSGTTRGWVNRGAVMSTSRPRNPTTSALNTASPSSVSPKSSAAKPLALKSAAAKPGDPDAKLFSTTDNSNDTVKTEKAKPAVANPIAAKSLALPESVSKPTPTISKPLALPAATAPTPEPVAKKIEPQAKPLKIGAPTKAETAKDAGKAKVDGKTKSLALAAPAPAAAAPVATPQSIKLAKPAAKPENTRGIIAEKTQTVATKIKPEEPASKPKMAAKECASDLAEFRRSPRLVAALGANYNPFVTWNGSWGTQIVPGQHGKMIMKIPAWAAAIAHRPETTDVHAEICADDKSQNPYLMIEGVRQPFDDGTGNRLTLADPNDSSKSSTFVRSAQ